jgi:hypothetical protein
MDEQLYRMRRQELDEKLSHLRSQLEKKTALSERLGQLNDEYRDATDEQRYSKYMKKQLDEAEKVGREALWIPDFEALGDAITQAEWELQKLEHEYQISLRKKW